MAIQQELAGATDSQLARVPASPLDARPTVLPGPVPAVVVPDGGDPPTGGWRTAGAAGTPRSAAPAQPPAVAPCRPAAPRRASFWRDRPVAAFTAPAAEASGGSRFGGPHCHAAGCAARGRATLLLEPGRELAAADLDAILGAAGPLLAVLRGRGLDGEARTPDEDADRIPDLADHEARPARRAENEPRREHP